MDVKEYKAGLWKQTNKETKSPQKTFLKSFRSSVYSNSQFYSLVKLICISKVEGQLKSFYTIQYFTLMS